MKIPVTSSWFTPLPPIFARIGISRSAPRGQSGYKRYSKLAPGPWFRSVSAEEYRQRYMAQLNQLDPRLVLTELETLAGDLTPALLCFEKPNDDAWCHRGYVSAWLNDKLGIEVVEYGRERDGCGWSHPKLPDGHRL